MTETNDTNWRCAACNKEFTEEKLQIEVSVNSNLVELVCVKCGKEWADWMSDRLQGVFK